MADPIKCDNSGVLDGEQAGVRIGLLGPPVFTSNGASVDIGGPKAWAVLVTLAHHLDEIVRVDTLIDALWGDDPPETARNVIQVRVSSLRRTLGQSLEFRPESAGYMLEAAGISVDAVEFERLVESAGELLDEDPARALALLDQALKLWRGDPLAAELDIRPLDGRVAALREMLVSAQSTRLDARLRLGQHGVCCADAKALADEHPYREDIRALHLLALYRSGRQTEALAAFRHTRDLLVDELGVEPGPELQTLHRQILNQDRDLDLLPPTSVRPIASKVTVATDNLRPEPNLAVERPENAAIIDALQPGRVVTVVGTGGIGKSRCVNAAARQCVQNGSFPDGVWIVDLAPLPGSSDQVAASVAAALGLGPQPGVSTLDTIVGYLSGRQMLLVLDSCEHVASAAATFADTVAAQCTTTAILTASRVRLGLLAEVVVTLQPLPDVAARRLLAARIAESGAGPFTDDACSELCVVLDNYPLAIELAAARTKSLSPSEIAARLSQQPQLLASPTVAVPRQGGRRHADVAAALDWSLGQLTTRARDTLDRAAVFVSDFDLDTAEAVLSTAETSAFAVVEDLGELVEHHLISRDQGRARFKVLAPIRQHLRAGGSREIQQRYTAHFGAFAIDAAQGLRGPNETLWWDRWRRELPHVREAVRLATDDQDVDLLNSIMSQMAITISICVITEPGEWAIDALRRLELDPIEAPGIAAAAAAQFANLDLIEECDAILDPLQAATDDPWMRATVACVRIYREPGETRWAEALHDAAEACGDPAILTLAKVFCTDPDMVNFADEYGNPTLLVLARQLWSNKMALDRHSPSARLNKEEIYRIALTSNNPHTIAEGEMFMALQYCFDQKPHRAGPLCANMIERMVRVRSPHWVWHGVEAIATMLAMVRIDPFTSEMLWAAVSAAGRPPLSRVLRDPTLPAWVATQLTDLEIDDAVNRGSGMDMDVAARAARKAAELMSDS